MESREEYKRILGNPDNIILSDDLREMLSDQESGTEENSYESFQDEIKVENSCLVFEGEKFQFQVTKIKRITHDIFSFEGSSLTFPVLDFLNGKAFKLKLFNTLFSLEEGHSVVYKTAGILTFTARRIISNEEI